MAPSRTYLQLAPEMGGLRFGPFAGVIQVGSERTRNQLVLDPSHGIFPSHATIVETAPGVYTIAPVEHGCQVFLVPQAGPQMWPVHAPVQARSGDVVVFGTPAGPRFQLQAAVTAAAVVGAAASAASAGAGAIGSLFSPPATSAGTTYGGRIANEAARVSRAKMLTRSPWRELYAISTRLRTGALTNPRVIVAAVSAVVAALLGGGLTCSGLLLAVWNAVMR